MIDILKKEIERKIGKKIKDRGDCELVSNVILENLQLEISYSTIRRLYGLVNETKPNNKTLNTLIIINLVNQLKFMFCYYFIRSTIFESLFTVYPLYNCN